MDFFEHQDIARRKTNWLVYAYLLTVLIIVVSVDIVAFLALSAGSRPRGLSADEWYVGGLVAVTAIVLFIVWLGQFLKKRELRMAGPAIAELLGGRQVFAGSRDPVDRLVWNVVEEMALASGMAVPEIYLLDDEQGINAFAAGTSLDDAVIGITHGCATRLSRDELQGVVAHEFSHIVSGDMRLNVKLVATLAGITLLSHVGYIILRGSTAGSGRRSSSSSKEGGGGGQIVLIGLAMYVLGAVGAFAAAIIQSAISKQREFFADASAVQFTRNPGGIGGALRAIGGFSGGSRLETSRAGEVRHMFFGQGIKTMFSTHPPLDERIKRIDGGAGLETAAETSAEANVGGAVAGVAGFAGASGTSRPVAAVAATAAVAAGATVSLKKMIGKPTAAHVNYAQQLIKEIPGEIRSAVGEAFAARGVVLCLLLDKDEMVRDIQLESIANAGDAGLLSCVQKLWPQFAQLEERMRVPLLDMAKGSLKGMTRDQYKTFKVVFEQVVQADDRLSLYEWMVTKSLVSHLDANFFGSRKKKSSGTLGSFPEALNLVLSALAHAGGGVETVAKQSYATAVDSLGLPLEPLRARRQCRVSDLDQAMSRLSTLRSSDMEKFLGACVVGIASDRKVSQLEAELLRVLSETLGCPVPPLLPGQQFST